MWEFDAFFAKAKLYFQRGAEHPKTSDDEFGLWLLLGLEFLLRAPLARVHPTLLAAMDGESIMHAAGFPGGKEAKSVPTHTVITRLQSVVPGFDQDRQRDATLLTSIRNSELHSGEAAVANAPIAEWLPRFLRVVEVVCTHLGVEVADVLGAEVETQARALKDAQDARVRGVVARKTAAAKTLFAGLRPEEVTARRATVPVVAAWYGQKVLCPVCETSAPLDVTYVRTAAERLEEDHILSDQIYVAHNFLCPVCALHLGTTAEVAAAGLPQQFVVTEEESFEDRYIEDHVEWEYGND